MHLTSRSHPQTVSLADISVLGEGDCREMLDLLGFPTLDALIERTVPQKSIRQKRPLQIGEPFDENSVLDHLRKVWHPRMIFSAHS